MDVSDPDTPLLSRRPGCVPAWDAGESLAETSPRRQLG
jgi:hypothetical protein